MKKFFRMTALAVLALCLFAGCKQDVDNGKSSPEFIAPAAGESISTFTGTWINDDSGWHSEYVVSASLIKDCSMNCEFNIVPTDTVKSADGYTLVFTKCTAGTEYTPAGNYYAIALKLDNGKLNISCPIDYLDVNTTLEQLKKHYSASFKVLDNNYTSECTLKTEGAKDPVIVKDNTYSSCQVKFEENKVALYQAGINGMSEYSYATFTPKRDTSKETGNTLLYLYSETDRSLAVDMLYVKITKSGSENKIYYYLYDEEEDDEMDSAVAACNEVLSSVSDTDLAKIKALYE